MRKIVSEHLHKKKQKRNAAVVGVILVLLMASSVLGYAFIHGKGDGNSEPEKVEYKGVEFYPQNNLWVAEKGEHQLALNINPVELNC